MIPTKLHVENFRSFAELDLDFPGGATAIVGVNGSGKSSILLALDVALFGARNIGDYLSRGSEETEMLVELEFLHADELYRVRRSYSARGRGKSTTDFERLDEHMVQVEGHGDGGPDEVPAHAWMPLTKETQAATQEAIEETLGISRATLHASALLMQGHAGVWIEAQPRDRKRVLAEILALHVWDQLLERARVDKRVAEREREQVAGRLALLEEQGSAQRRGELLRAVNIGNELVATAEHDHANAEQALTAAAERVRDVEQAQERYLRAGTEVAAARANLAARQAVVDRAGEAKTQAVEVRKQLDDAGDPAAAIAKLEADLAEMNTARERSREQTALRDRYLAEAKAAEREHDGMKLDVQRAILAFETACRKVAELQETGNVHRCDRCEQEIHGEAFQRTFDSLVAERDAAQGRRDEISERMLALVRQREASETAAAEVEIPAPPDETLVAALAHDLSNARQSELALAGLRRDLANFEATIAEATPELTAEVARLSAEVVVAESALAAIEEPEPGALERARAEALAAKGRVEDASRKLAESRTALVRAEAALEAAQKIAEELRAAGARRQELLGEIDLLSDCEHAYGPNGVPAHIVENRAIPSIETEANRILDALGTSYRVELHTQRALKSGEGLADTLDIVVVTEEGARPYETFSGGEGSRLNVALRLALARLLANRRGAEIGMLVLDEVEYLDEAGQAALVDVLLGLRSEFEKIVVVSHASGIRDAPLDGLIELVNEDGRSRIVGQAVEAEAVAA